MSIVKMKRLGLLAMREDREAILHALQGLGCVEISEPTLGPQGDEDAAPAVAGVHGGTGDDQVAHPGQAGEGVLPSAQGHPQAGHLRQPPGHQQGLGVVPTAHAVGAAGTQGDDVFQGGADLGPDPVVAGIDPEALVHKQVLDLLGSRPVP